MSEEIRRRLEVTDPYTPLDLLIRASRAISLKRLADLLEAEVKTNERDSLLAENRRLKSELEEIRKVKRQFENA